MGQFEDLGIVVPRWLDAYFETKQACVQMPKALTHGEMYFQQVGRSGGGALVLFDLAREHSVFVLVSSTRRLPGVGSS